MRKYQRQQIENRVAHLHDYHQESRNHLSRNDFPVTRDILGRCQKLAIEIGESIEQTEGEGTEMVSFLEQYCERVYQISEQMQEMTAQKAYRYLEGILIKAENEIRRIPVRKEVVFLPYKASMWDSLESVYLAAKEDEQCDAYVVPIPYYDKNADKSLGEMHYEGASIQMILKLLTMKSIRLRREDPTPFISIISMTAGTVRPVCRNVFLAGT